LEIERNRDFK